MARAQVNLWFPYNYIDYPFLDVAHMVSGLWSAPSASEDIYALLDANGYPTKMAAGSTEWVAYTNIYVPEDALDPWVLTWDNGSTTAVSLSGVTSTVVSTTRRREYTVDQTGKTPGDNVLAQIRIGAITEGNHPTNIRIFRKSQEAALNGGQIWADHFLARYSGWKRIRFMDWQWTNGSPEIQWSLRAQTTDMSWTGFRLLRDVYCGRCTVSNNDYTAPNALTGNPSAWTDGMVVQVSASTYPVFKTITSITNANPAVVTATAHGLTTGDLVFFQNVTGGEWSWRLNKFAINDSSSLNTDIGWAWPVTVTDANTFSIDGANGTAWGTFTAGVVAKQVRVKAGSLPFKKVVSGSFNNLFPTFPNSASGQNLWTLIYDEDADALMLTIGAVGAGLPMSMPIALIVDLANELQVDPWVCIPHLANDDYITQFATYLRDNVDPGLTICIEWSNEVWNGAAGFGQTPHGRRKAMLLWGLQGTQAANEWYGYNFHRAMTIFASVFAGQMHRLDRIFSMWTAMYTTTPTTQRFTASNTGVAATPVSLCDSISIAGYFGASNTGAADAEQVWKYKQGGTQREEAFDWLAGRFASGADYTMAHYRDTLYPAWVAVATAQGKKLTQYEGGFGFLPSGSPLTASTYNGDSLTTTNRDNFFYDFYKSRQFGHLLTQHLNNFVRLGGEYPAQYCLVATWGSSTGMWGLVEPNTFGEECYALDDLRVFNEGKRRLKLT